MTSATPHLFHRYTLAVFCALMSSDLLGKDTYEIFILHSYSQEYPWTKSQHNGFVTRLQEESSHTNVFSTEYLDSKRRENDAQYESQFLQYLNSKYDYYLPDLIYVTDDSALQFAFKHFDRLFPNTAIIFSGLNNRQLQKSLDPSHFTGVFEEKDISGNLDILQMIDPAVSNILVVGDNSITYKAIENDIREQLNDYPEITATFIADKQLEKLTHTLKNRDETYLFLTTLGGIEDNAGNNLPLKQVIAAIVDSADFTIISTEDGYLQEGVLGGLVTSGKNQGSYAARLALEYQRGTPLERIAMMSISPNEYIFDYRELHRKQITLPASIYNSANILNPPPTFYQRYKVMIISAIVILIALIIVSILIFMVLITRKNILIQLTSSKKSELETLVRERTSELESEKEKLNQAQAITHIGSYSWDIHSNITRWTDELYRIVGRSKDNFTPSYEAYVNCIYIDDRERFMRLTGDALKNRNQYSAEYRIARPDGEIRHIYEQGQTRYNEANELIGLMGVIQDITQRKQSESDLKKQNDFTDTVVEVAGNIIAIIDLNGCFVRFNRAAEELTGFDRSEVLGKAVWDTVIPEEQIPGVKNVFENLRSGKTNLATQYINDWVGKQGNRRTIDWRNSVLRNELGEIIYIVALGYDMTDRLASEHEQERLQRELNQSRKMEALGQLTGGIAHDFNNMLGIIMGYTDLALEQHRDELDNKLKTYLENISQATKRAKNLISQMMVFSRNDRGKSEPLHLDTIVNESITMLRSIIPSSIKINYKQEDKLPLVLMDAGQMQQALINLCLNAKDAMEGVGTLTLTLGWNRGIGSECIACHKEVTGDWIDLSIADTGSGIEAEILERIFEPFFTTKDVGKGTGMGLSVLHTIVDSHGGHILIDTIINQGTTFHLLFPPVTEHEHPGPEYINESKNPGIQGHGKRVLIVDDEEPITGYLSEVLNNYGFKCTTCTESLMALKLFSATQEFDLVITDQTMPELTGIELIRKFRQLAPDLPAILATGYNEVIDKETAEKEHIAFLYKPVSTAKLIETVARLLPSEQENK